MVVAVVFARRVCVDAHGLAPVTLKFPREMDFHMYFHVFPLGHYIVAFVAKESCEGDIHYHCCRRVVAFFGSPVVVVVDCMGGLLFVLVLDGVERPLGPLLFLRLLPGSLWRLSLVTVWSWRLSLWLYLLCVSSRRIHFPPCPLFLGFREILQAPSVLLLAGVLPSYPIFEICLCAGPPGNSFGRLCLKNDHFFGGFIKIFRAPSGSLLAGGVSLVSLLWTLPVLEST